VTTLPRAKIAAGPEVADGPSFAAFREVPRTGVIFVTTEAQRRGYSPSSEDWCYLGQGMPESGALPGATKLISAALSYAADGSGEVALSGSPKRTAARPRTQSLAR
jgi:hypothetical protein